MCAWVFSPVQLPINKLSDQLRAAIGQAGFTECLTFVLVGVPQCECLGKRVHRLHLYYVYTHIHTHTHMHMHTRTHTHTHPHCYATTIVYQCIFSGLKSKQIICYCTVCFLYVSVLHSQPVTVHKYLLQTNLLLNPLMTSLQCTSATQRHCSFRVCVCVCVCAVWRCVQIDLHLFISFHYHTRTYLFC